MKLTKELIDDILDMFTGVDIELIKDVIYFDGWSSYEESGGYLIFTAVDDTIQLVDYGYSVMSDDNSNQFHLQEITKERADMLVSEMNGVGFID